MRGEQLLSIVKNGELVKFNSRPCGRGDAEDVARVPVEIISIHAPAGGATRGNRRRTVIIGDFNSRPCGRGDHGYCRFSGYYHISIHAPAGGATADAGADFPGSAISIHAPAGGATYGQYQRDV